MTALHGARAYNADLYLALPSVVFDQSGEAWPDATTPRTSQPARFLAADPWDPCSHTVRGSRAVPSLPEGN